MPGSSIIDAFMNEVREGLVVQNTPADQVRPILATLFAIDVPLGPTYPRVELRQVVIKVLDVYRIMTDAIPHPDYLNASYVNRLIDAVEPMTSTMGSFSQKYIRLTRGVATTVQAPTFRVDLHNILVALLSSMQAQQKIVEAKPWYVGFWGGSTVLHALASIGDAEHALVNKTREIGAAISAAAEAAVESAKKLSWLTSPVGLIVTGGVVYIGWKLLKRKR